uniref:Uncharacterized protein n=1 Tax=Thermogemmatispora argillosa TaxID=2045280 RepID=A0A455T4S2_9CHLR|nr:hypothetical protein KTA_23900 [Thermogemmatispora argillosa]
MILDMVHERWGHGLQAIKSAQKAAEEESNRVGIAAKSIHSDDDALLRVLEVFQAA